MILIYLFLSALGIWAVTWLCSLDVVENFVEWFAFAAVALVMAGIAVPCYGAYQWLRYGEWASIPMHQALGWFDLLQTAGMSTGWVGIDGLALGYLHSSAGWTLFFGGLFVGYCVIYWSEEGDTRRRATKMRAEIEHVENLD